MGQERGVPGRPAGAPMVPVEPPPWARRDGAGGDGASAAQVAAEAKDAGRQIAGEARRAAGEQIDRRSTMAGDRVGTAAGDARDIAQTLRGKGREAPARFADQAADRMEQFAQYLRDADADRIMSDIRRVGREQPAALVAGAAVVGVLVGRIAKAGESGSQPSPQGRQISGGVR